MDKLIEAAAKKKHYFNIYMAVLIASSSYIVFILKDTCNVDLKIIVLLTAVLGLLVIYVYFSFSDSYKNMIERIEELNEKEKIIINKEIKRSKIKSEELFVTSFGVIGISIKRCMFVNFNEIDKISLNAVRNSYYAIIHCNHKLYSFQVDSLNDLYKLKKIVLSNCNCTIVKNRNIKIMEKK